MKRDVFTGSHWFMRKKLSFLLWEKLFQPKMVTHRGTAQCPWSAVGRYFPMADSQGKEAPSPNSPGLPTSEEVGKQQNDSQEKPRVKVTLI